MPTDLKILQEATRIYLSIDLDFWEYGVEGLGELLQDVMDHTGHFYLVASHEQLLPRINRMQGDAIINIDTHSDFPGTGTWLYDPIARKQVADLSPLDPLGDGTWAEHVKWKGQGVFIWRYPSRPRARWSGCCAGGNPDPFNTSWHGWGRRAAYKGIGKIPWERVVEVGLAISIEYLTWFSKTEALGHLMLEILGKSTIKRISDISPILGYLDHSRPDETGQYRYPDQSAAT